MKWIKNEKEIHSIFYTLHITHTHTACMHTGNGKLWMDCDQLSSFIIIFFTWNSTFQKSQTIIIIVFFSSYFWYPYIYEHLLLRHAWWAKKRWNESLWNRKFNDLNHQKEFQNIRKWKRNQFNNETVSRNLNEVTAFWESCKVESTLNIDCILKVESFHFAEKIKDYLPISSLILMTLDVTAIVSNKLMASFKSEKSTNWIQKSQIHFHFWNFEFIWILENFNFNITFNCVVPMVQIQKIPN